MDTATRQPVTVQTLFQAGSISKSLNAVGVLKLIQDKKLDLYTDINTYLSSWKFPYDSLSKGKKITIANLLSHTAGLTIHGFPGYKRSDSIPSLPQVLDGKHPANTKAVRSQFEPGLRFQYSGGGTTISQLIVQDVTREAYDEYMWKNVLKPLDMTMSSYTQPPSKDKEKFVATGYRADGKEVEEKYHVYPEQAAAGLWTNPTDLAKYITETQLSLQGKSNKVLSQEMTKLRLTPYVDSSAAFGVFIDEHGGEKYFGHNGADEGFLSAYTGSFDSGNGVVVMVNSDNGAVLSEVINSVATVYGWKDYYKPVRKKVVRISDSLFDTYAGNYSLEGDTISISRKGNGYFLTINNRRTFNIYFSSATDFFSKEISIEFKFEKDEQGKVKDFYFKDGNQEVRAKRL
jgi:CubicO group peptidase (beta-lactamase class C family)